MRDSPTRWSVLDVDREEPCLLSTLIALDEMGVELAADVKNGSIGLFANNPPEQLPVVLYSALVRHKDELLLCLRARATLPVEEPTAFS